MNNLKDLSMKVIAKVIDADTLSFTCMCSLEHTIKVVNGEVVVDTLAKETLVQVDDKKEGKQKEKKGFFS